MRLNHWIGFFVIRTKTFCRVVLFCCLTGVVDILKQISIVTIMFNNASEKPGYF